VNITSFAWLLGLREIASGESVPIGEHSGTLTIIDSGGNAAKPYNGLIVYSKQRFPTCGWEASRRQ
jgi:hypothetical protein